MGIEVPEEYGGAGLDPLSFVLVMEEIAAADGRAFDHHVREQLPLLQRHPAIRDRATKADYSAPIASGKGSVPTA